MNTELTPKQKELFDWIGQFIDQHGFSPSVREMMRGVGLKSPAPVQARLEILKKKGLVRWVDRQTRTVRIVQAQTAAAA
jgi:repressor LexA